MYVYYNNYEDRPTTDYEVNTYKKIDSIMMKISFDDFIYVMDTLREYRRNNVHYSIEDIEMLANRYSVTTTALLLYYDVEEIKIW